MDFTTTFLGLNLKNPLIASASPLTSSVESIRRLEDNDIAAVIMHSLFEEEINHEIHQIDHFLHINSNSYAEALTYLPDEVDFENLQADNYLEEIRRIKESTDIPLVASLNGISAGGWIRYAKKLEEAGADALELNITYIPTSMEMEGYRVEQMYIDTVASVAEKIDIPLNVKMNAYFSNPANMAKRFVEAGAKGLTLFDNPTRVEVDLELLSPLQRANITTSYNLSETLRWCAILYGKLSCSLCANTGIHSGEDVLKAIMSGADATALASVLLTKGEGEIKQILSDMGEWMAKHEYESISQMKGSISLAHTDNPSVYERNSYMYALQHYRR
ncbi:MAG: dihydroorotate dehydrogenase [Sulfuricurvum sp. GWF2_44_89]|uniref:Dihydroorotate dehydrogenase n=1 Tax=Sulfuricurvum kujiense TaxID=148813 RepID=A0A2D3WE98_9BACT|nr:MULTISPECIES: dihydroorotate dehydrogenase-like protein [Sulfuricurvum]OHD78768.1 MAG: dihydroorotate dehydrogenase [Sulfuricurvum sp. GWF2_44_89]OHD95206.1 MAG: dihydroorotate dehydrogenase [Sulfuricurvum sp. RIFOXYD12_FULL_44_77]OHD99098.1 MAG: dihydroorotate dehydrogenase [Sulfuricurvum sp. RIFOXYD2_FULL_44_160]DAB38758.1 MAG TPA: dihydroorotate dehydrogenase [Sulfuricurvum kujiense]